jgi:aminopeptidase
MSLMNTAEQSNRQLNQMAFDPELTPGARNAVRVCLRVQPPERVTVITDEACLEIAAALVHELDAVGCQYQTWVLEDVATRPLTDLPLAIS